MNGGCSIVRSRGEIDGDQSSTVARRRQGRASSWDHHGRRGYSSRWIDLVKCLPVCSVFVCFVGRQSLGVDDDLELCLDAV